MFSLVDNGFERVEAEMAVRFLWLLRKIRRSSEISGGDLPSQNDTRCPDGNELSRVLLAKPWTSPF